MEKGKRICYKFRYHIRYLDVEDDMNHTLSTLVRENISIKYPKGIKVDIYLTM